MLNLSGLKPGRFHSAGESGGMADHNSAEIGFEKEIWDAACVLRGNIDAAELFWASSF
jgi:hypothetical protein